MLDSIEVNTTFIDEIKVNQYGNENMQELKKNDVIGKSQENTLDSVGVLRFKGRICDPRVDDLIQKLLTFQWFALFYSSGCDKDVSTFEADLLVFGHEEEYSEICS